MAAVASAAPVGGIDHDELHTLGGSNGGVDTILSVAAGVQYQGAIGYYNGATLGLDFDGSNVDESWSRSYATSGQAGFVYQQEVGTTNFDVMLLEPTGSNGTVRGWALDLGYYGIDSAERYYIGGWYSGSGMYTGVRELDTPSSGEDGFVARLTGTSPWAGQLLGGGNARVYCLESSRDLVYVGSTSFLERLPLPGEDGTRSTEDAAIVVACAGTFSSTLQYEYDDQVGPVSVGTSNGGLDAYILVLSADTGELLSSVTFGGSGDEDIRDLAVSFVETGEFGTEVPAVFVTGSFTGTVNFDPNGTTTNKTPTGDRDIFVAQYHADEEDLVLDWVWTSGTADKEAAGEGIDVLRSGEVFDVYVAGWNDYESGQTPNDVWFARLNYDPDGNPELSVAWEHELENSYICKAFDVAFDAYNQFVMTGYYAGTLDFDADGSATDQRSSAGTSYDIFVTRYSFAGDYGGTDVYGSTGYSDVGYAIDVNKETGSIVHGGYFGGGSSSGYTVDFDPDPNGTANGVSRGDADGFINAFVPDIPDVDTAIMLILDASGSMTLEECSTGYSYWDAMIDAYDAIIATDGTVVPRDGSVALAATIYSDETDARQVIPWTAIDSAVAATGFASALKAIDPPGSSSELAPAMTIARESFEAGDVEATHFVINVVGNGFTDENDAEDERDLALDPDDGVVELINGIPIETDTPNLADDFYTYVIGYNTAISATGRYGCVAVADGDYAICPPSQGISVFHLQQIVKFVFEITGCRGDWDQDCIIDQSELGDLLSRWGAEPGSPAWHQDYDLDGSNKIDQGDLGILLAGMSDCDEPE